MVTRVHHVLFRIPAEVLISVGVHGVLVVALVIFVSLPESLPPEEQAALVSSVAALAPPLPEPPPPEDRMPPEPEPALERDPVPLEKPPELPDIFEEPDAPALDPSDLLPAPDFRDTSRLKPKESVIGIGGGQAGSPPSRPPPPKPAPKPRPAPPPTRAKPTARPAPEYPSRAVARELQGRVVLLVEVLPSGEVGRIDVKQSSGYSILDRAAINAVGQWHFRPAFARGQPVRSIVEVPFSFKLSE